MLWVIDGLVYGFFTAIYTLFNQHYKLNGYVLGIWRGFGISLAFMPFCIFSGAGKRILLVSADFSGAVNRRL